MLLWCKSWLLTSATFLWEMAAEISSTCKQEDHKKMMLMQRGGSACRMLLSHWPLLCTYVVPCSSALAGGAGGALVLCLLNGSLDCCLVLRDRTNMQDPSA